MLFRKAGAIFTLCIVLLSLVLLFQRELSSLARASAEVEEDHYLFLPVVQNPPPQHWIKGYLGNFYWVWDAQPTLDGGSILFGMTYDDDAFAIRLNSAGEVAWAKYYGGSWMDYFRSGLATSDGGFVAAGATRSFGNNGLDWDIWVLKLSATGTVSWARMLGGSEDEGDYPFSIAQDNDGGYIVASESRSFGSGNNAWVFKLSDKGDLVWQKIIGGDGSEVARAASGTSDGGIVFTGSTYNSTSVGGGWVVKLNSAGGNVWQKVYRNGSCYPGGIQELPGGDFGWTGIGASGACVIRLNSNGGFVWGKNFSDGDEGDRFYDAYGTADGGMIVTGESDAASTGDYGPWAVKLNKSGSIIWQKKYGLSGHVSAIVGIEPGDLLLAGAASTKLFKANGNGAIEDCPAVGNTSRVTENIAPVVTNVNLSISDSSAVLVELNVDGQDISATKEVICPSSLASATCQNE